MIWRSVVHGVAMWALAQGLLAQGEKPTVIVGITVHEVKFEPATPDYFYTRFSVSYRWDPAKLPAFDPLQIEFSNEQQVMVSSLVEPSEAMQPPAKELREETVLYAGRFKAFNDFRDFPFDEHDLPLLMSGPREGGFEFESAPDLLKVGERWPAPLLSRLDGFRLLGVSFFNDPHNFLHLAPRGALSGEVPVAAFSINVRRDILAASMQLILPLLVIWLVGYLGFFWDDSSPASRCGSSSLFAAVAFSLAIRYLHPSVNYLTALHALVVGLYVNLAISTIGVTAVFWCRKRTSARVTSAVWWCGVLACPLLLFLTLFWSYHIASHARLDFDFEPGTATVRSVP